MQEAQETPGKSLGPEDPLEEEMATHSSIAWKIPWTEKPVRLQSKEHTWAHMHANQPETDFGYNDYFCINPLPRLLSSHCYLTIIFRTSVAIMDNFNAFVEKHWNARDKDNSSSSQHRGFPPLVEWVWEAKRMLQHEILMWSAGVFGERLRTERQISTWKGTVSKWVCSVFKKRVKHFCQEMRIVVGNKEWFNSKAKSLDLWLMRWADFCLTGRQGGGWNIRANNTHGHLKKGFNSPCMTLHYYSVAAWQINTN